MKKIVLSIIAVLTFSSCCESIQSHNEKKAEEIMGKVIYAKDPKTGLCFVLTGSGERDSRTEINMLVCVPCDSLKNVSIINLK